MTEIVPGSGFCATLIGSVECHRVAMTEGIRIRIKKHEGGVDYAWIMSPWMDEYADEVIQANAVVMCVLAKAEPDNPRALDYVVIGRGSTYPTILTAFNPLHPPAPESKVDQAAPGAARLDGIGERFEASPDMLKLTRRQVLDRFGVSRWEKGWEIKSLYPTVLATAEFIEAAFLASRLQVLPVHIQKTFRRLFGWRKMK